MARLNVPLTVEAQQAKQELNSFNAEMRKTEEIFRLAEKEMVAMGDATGKLQAEYGALTQKIDIQSSVIEKQKTILSESRKEIEEKRAAMDKANDEYERGKVAFEGNETELRKLEKALKDATNQFEAAQKRAVAWNHELEKAEITKRTFEASLKSVADEMENVGVSTENTENSFWKIATAAAAADVGVRAVSAAASSVSNYLAQGAKMAEQFSQAQSQLELVMRNSMGATAEHVGVIHELTAAQQEFGIVSQSAQLAGAQNLVLHVQNKEALQALIPVMNDLVAQQYGINASQQKVSQIGQQMGRVLSGNVRAMERMGFVFDAAQEKIMKYGDESERVATLIEVITSSVGGMNEALAQTDVGRQAQLNNVLAETQQRIGEVWNSLRAEVSAEAFPAIEAMFTDLLQLVEDNRDSIAGLMSILTGMVSFIANNARVVATSIGAVGLAIAGMKLNAAIASVKAWSASKLAAATATNTLTGAKVADAAATGVQTGANVAGTAAIGAKTKAVILLTAALKANPLFAVGAGVAVIAGTAVAVRNLTSGIRDLTSEFENQRERVRELSDEFRRLERDVSETERNLDIVNRRITEIRNQGSISVIDKEELERLERAAEILQSEMLTQEQEYFLARVAAEREAIDLLQGIPERIIRHIQLYNNLLRDIEYGRPIMQLPSNVLSAIERDWELIKELEDSLSGVTDRYGEMRESINAATEARSKHVAQMAKEQGFIENVVQSAATASEAVAQAATQTRTAVNDAAQSLNALSEAYRDGEISGREYAEVLREMLVDIDALAEKYPDLASEFDQLADVIQSQLSRSPEHLDNLRRATSSLAGEVDTLRRALDEQNEAGQLNVNTIMRLIENGYAAALSIDAETGAVRLNAEAYIELAQARIKAQIAELETARLNIEARLERETASVRALTQSKHGMAKSTIAAAHAHSIAAAAAREETAALEQQINILEHLLNMLAIPASHDRPVRSGGGGNAARDTEREAEDERRTRVSAWEAAYREREELSRAWIDRRRFFNDLSAEREIAANERVLEYLRGYLDEVESLYFATDEERARIRRDILQRIERYERAHWTAQRRLVQEGEVDRSRAERDRTDSLQRDIDRAENDLERYQAYGAMREALQTQLYATLEEISSRFWMNEREKLHAMEDAHRDHKRQIERIEDRMHNLRLQRLNEQASAWRATEIEQLDETRRRLDLQHQAQRDAKNRELDALREHFAALDAEERRRDRSNDLASLKRDAEIWENAATQSGRERFENIQRQIENLQRQEERENRNLQRQHQEAAIMGQLQALDSNHARQIENIERQRAAVQEKYEAMRTAATRLAGETQIGLMEAGEALKDGLVDMYKEFDKNIERLTTAQVVKVQNMAVAIKTILSQIQTAFSRIGSFGGGTTINDNSRSMVLHSTNNFYGNDQQAQAQAWHETRDIMFRGSNMRV